MLSQDVVRRLSIVATESGLTSVNTKLREHERLQAQVTAGAARMSTATEAADRRMQALLRQRDRAVAAFNAGGAGAFVPSSVRTTANVAGAVGGFAIANPAATVAGIVAVTVAYKSLNAVWERGAELLEKYGEAHRRFDSSELASQMKNLTKYQEDTISASQVQRASELGVRLQEAKFTIDQFFKVHVDIVDPALKLQAAWVVTVETIAAATRALEKYSEKAASVPGVKAGASAVGTAALGAIPGGSLVTLGARAVNGMAGETPKVSDVDALAAAYKNLGAAMGTANVANGEFSKRGGAFAAVWNDIQQQLDGAGKKTKEVARATDDSVAAWNRAIASASKRISVQEAEAKAVGLGAGAQAKFRTEAELTEAAIRSGLDPAAEEVAKKIKEIGERAEESATKLASARLGDKIKFDSDTMFFTDKERQIAQEMKTVYGSEWQANMDSAYAKQLRLNDAMRDMRDAMVDGAAAFVQGMIDGKSAGESLKAVLADIGREMVKTGVKNMLLASSPEQAAMGAVQVGVGTIIQQFQKREQEKRAAEQAALEAERKADDLRRSRRAVTEQYTLRKSLVGLDETKQGDALAAFDLRAANEMLQARRLPGNLKKDQILLIEETLAAERLKIIEDFAKRAAEIERSYEDRIFAATNDTSTLEGSLAAFDRAAAREREQAAEAGGIAIGKLEEALAAERLRLIEDFVGKANMAESRRLGYADRLFAATNDASTLEGQLALFDRQAQRDREQEIANGGEAINELEAALAAERLQIIQQFVDQASAASARLLSYQDRLFAATNDTSTLAGQLAAFDRQAQRDREAEIAAGGEAILELEAALNAERLNVIQQFNSRIVDDTKQAEEQRRQALIQTTQQVLQYIQQLQTGTQSPLSPGARLAAAQASYDSTRALAMGGNAEAYAQFTQVAESLRQAAKDMYGSAAGYQTIFNNIVADGLNLTAPVAASDPVVAKLQEVVTAIGVANGSIVASTNGNVAAINAVTGAVNTQGNAASVYHNNTRLAVVGTTTAVDLTRTAVGATTTAVGANATTVSSAVGATTTAVGATTTAVNTNNNLVTTGNTIANDQLTEAQQAEALLNAIKGLGDIQREIGNAAAAQAAAIGTQTVFKLTQINRALDNQASSSSSSWSWLGFESGGVVGNGRWGRDSVMARYAGGGNIMLAGGEGVLTAGATAAIGGRAAIDYINRTGMMPANDNGGVVAAIASLQAEVRYLRAELAAVGREGNKIAAAHLEHDRDWGDRDQRQNKVAAPKVSRAA